MILIPGYLFKTIDNLEIETINLQTEFEILKSEKENLEYQLSLINENASREELALVHEKRLEQIKNLILSLGKEKISLKKIEQTRLYFNIGIFVLFGGAVLSTLGFLKWHKIEGNNSPFSWSHKHNAH